MKKVINNKWILVGATLVVGIIIGWLIRPSKNQQDEESAHQHVAESKNETWTCSMHPQIRQPEPGQCPLCGMDLIPVGNDESNENPMEIKMSPTAMQLASVQTAVVKKQLPFKEIRLNGKVQADERNVVAQTAHIGGRVEQLFINYTGEFITKGQVIGSIYSPELVSTQEELFQTDKIKATNPALFNAAKEKLKNWKLTDKQIEELLQTGKPKENFSIYADKSGVVINKKVNQGDYIKQGAVLYDVADLSSLWVLFDVYESDVSFVKKGNEVEYTIQSFPGEKFNGKVSFIDPIINPKTRVAKARIDINNKGLRFKPEMFVSGILKNALNGAKATIVIPKTAVMWTGEKSVVYVKTSEQKGVNFQLRQVVLGPSLGDSFIINKGLEEGEEIAVNGTFSIDAAAQLAGKPSMMNPEGGAVMTGHNHGGATPLNGNDSGHTKSVAISKEVKETIQPLFDTYFELKNALVQDDYEKAIKEGTAFQKQLSQVNMSIFKGEAHEVWMKYSDLTQKSIYALVNAKDITAVRNSFVALSEQMVMLVKTFQPIEKSIYVQHCPMANQDNGADWLSTEKAIKNPYFGASMLKCGEVTETIK